MKAILWYGTVILATLMLVFGMLFKSMTATMICVVLCLWLRKTSSTVGIPQIYKKMGISNKMFK